MSMDVWVKVVILLMYGSHDMRLTGFCELTGCQRTPGIWGVTSELLLDASKMLFLRLCPPFRLAGDGIVAFVVPVLLLPIVAITSGYVGAMLSGLAIFSSFTDV